MKIRIDAPINSLQQFRVITKDAGPKGLAELGVTITSPTNKVIHGHIVPTAEGFLVNFTPTELGEYLLGISYGGEAVSPSPFKMLCTPTTSSDSDKVCFSVAWPRKYSLETYVGLLAWMVVY